MIARDLVWTGHLHHGLSAFRSSYTNLFVNAAHNDYVQVLVETGLIGLAAVLWFIVEVYRAGLRNMEGWSRDWSRALGLAALIGCTGLLVHGFLDFNLQIPANACLYCFLCAVSTRTAEGLETSRRCSLGQADSDLYSVN